MSANAILFEAQGNFFEFDGQRGYDPDFVFSRTNRVYGQEQNALMVPVPVNPGDKYVALDAQGIGQLIAFAMANDITSISFRNCTVTVNYLVKMLQFKGRHGWFIDVLDDTADHKFDANSPTPGFHVGEAKQLVTRAAEIEAEARLYRAAWRLDEAQAKEAEAGALRQTARGLRFQR